MSSRTCCYGVVFTLALFSWAGAYAQEKAGKVEAPASKLGREHKELAGLAGEFTTVAKFRLKPEDEAMESKGTATIKSILDGQFLL